MKETIIQKMYDLLKLSIPILNQFPRNQKFLLADRIQNILSDLLEIYIEAYFSSGPRKKELLLKANIHLEKARQYIRLSHELGFISFKNYTSLAEQLHLIGRMTGGWIKKI